MNVTLIAINDSLTELKNSLMLDQQMIRNMRTALVKSQQFEKISLLKKIEEQFTEVMESIEAALDKKDMA